MYIQIIHLQIIYIANFLYTIFLCIYKLFIYSVHYFDNANFYKFASILFWRKKRFIVEKVDQGVSTVVEGGNLGFWIILCGVSKGV